MTHEIKAHHKKKKKRKKQNHVNFKRFIEYNFPEAGVKTEGILFLFLCCTVNELISDKTSCLQTFTKKKKKQPKNKNENKQPPGGLTAAKG